MTFRSDETTLPAARFDGLSVEPLDREVLVYDHDADTAHCVSGLAAELFMACREGETYGDFRARSGAPDSEIDDAFVQLRDAGLMETFPVITSSLSRRQLVGRMAATAAGAVMVTSIVAPTAAMAASGRACPGTGASSCNTRTDGYTKNCNTGGACQFCCQQTQTCGTGATTLTQCI